jgi:hypothetical protein
VYGKTSKQEERPWKIFNRYDFIEAYEVVHNAPAVLSQLPIGIIQLGLNLIALYGIWTWKSGQFICTFLC